MIGVKTKPSTISSGHSIYCTVCSHILPPHLSPSCPPPTTFAQKLVHWDPLTGKVDGVDSTASKNRAGSAPVKPEVQIGGGGGDETDEGENDLEGVLERFEWYRRLFDFSGDIPPPESAGYGAEEDPDQNLVPQVMMPACRDLVLFFFTGVDRIDYCTYLVRQCYDKQAFFCKVYRCVYDIYWVCFAL